MTYILTIERRRVVDGFHDRSVKPEIETIEVSTRLDALSIAEGAFQGRRRTNPDVEYSLGFLHSAKDYWSGEHEFRLGDPYNGVNIHIERVERT